METANSFSQQQQQKQIQTLAPQQLASLSLLSLPVMLVLRKVNPVPLNFSCDK